MRRGSFICEHRLTDFCFYQTDSDDHRGFVPWSKIEDEWNASKLSARINRNDTVFRFWCILFVLELWSLIVTAGHTKRKSMGKWEGQTVISSPNMSATAECDEWLRSWRDARIINSLIDTVAYSSVETTFIRYHFTSHSLYDTILYVCTCILPYPRDHFLCRNLIVRLRAFDIFLQ